MRTNDRVIRVSDPAAAELPPLRHPVVTLGTFDGVHLGHQKILKEVVKRARRRGGNSVVATFDPHPRQVLNPALSPDLLTTTQQRVDLILKQRIDVICLIEFTREFSNTDPADFVETFLVGKVGMEEMVVGYDTRFGMARRGDRTLLEQLAPKHGFSIEEVGPLQVQNQTVSSSLIRELLQLGDIKLANELLGRYYTLMGEVVRGEGLGRKLGFPTANLRPFQEAIPPNGVYAVFVRIGRRRFHGTMNIGVRPTVRESLKRTIEVYVHDFDGDLYGREVQVHLVQKIREEARFRSLEELAAHIAKDVAASERILLAVKP